MMVFLVYTLTVIHCVLSNKNYKQKETKAMISKRMVKLFSPLSFNTESDEEDFYDGIDDWGRPKKRNKRNFGEEDEEDDNDNMDEYE